ncbi:MAG: AMP-binding protein [Microthrixaceae bacterium]|nr:AMP-binding protein [Microthrixaceae bacterium]
MTRLVAVALPGGPAFVETVRRIWDDGDAVAPLDPAAPPPLRRSQIEALRPHAIVEDGRSRLLDDPLDMLEGDATAMLTSGTSGPPRAVIHTHAAIESAAHVSATALGVDPDVKWLACLPLHHVGGFGVIARSLVTATELEVHPRFDASAVDEAATRGATHVSLVPTALGRIDATRWRRILLGGSRPAQDRPPNTVATYGMTETFGGIVYDHLALPGNEVAVGADGELLVRSPALARSFRDGRALVGPDGWFHTGDLGSIDPATGQVSVSGRAGDVINTGGEKVWPTDVEAVLSLHPAVSEVAVVGRDDPEWGRRVVALVVPADHSNPPTLESLRALATEHLPPAAAPKELTLVDALPRTSLGKVRRAEL